MMKRESILIVEDDPHFMKLLEYNLGKYYQITNAANGIQALESIGKKAPDMIISDIMMPEMDGYTLKEALKNKMGTDAIPFMFITAKGTNNERQKGLALGIDDYLVKPIERETLLSRVRQILDRAKIYKQSFFEDLQTNYVRQNCGGKTLALTNGFDLYFQILPADVASGDYVEIFTCRDGDSVVALGDIAGKGLKAKYFSSTYWAYLKTVFHIYLRNSNSLTNGLIQLNGLLCNDPSLEDIFTTLICLKLGKDRNRITSINAGHLPVLWWRADEGQLEHIEARGPLLGLHEGVVFPEIETLVRPNDRLVIVSDGVIEAINKEGFFYGMERLQDVISKNGSFNPEALAKSLLYEVSEFRSWTPANDDVTVMVISRS